MSTIESLLKTKVAELVALNLERDEIRNRINSIYPIIVKNDPSKLERILDECGVKELGQEAAAESDPSVFTEEEQAEFRLPLVPTELKQKPNWVRWKLESVSGRLTKVPYQLNDNKASSTDPKTWNTYGAIVKGVVLSETQGIGIMTDSSFVGFDLDGCRNPQTGEITEWAKRIVNLLGTYCEVTPSGTGVRVYALGTLPDGARRFSLDVSAGFGDKVGIECYSDKRYFAVTGNRIGDVSGMQTPNVAQAHQLCAAISREFPSEKRKSVASNGTDDGGSIQIERGPGLMLTSKLALLMYGTIASEKPFVVQDDHGNKLTYPSHSEADLALATMLAMKHGDNPELIDADFRESVLYRPKWDRLAEATIRKAIDSAKKCAAESHAETVEVSQWRKEFRTIGQMEQGDILMLIDGFLPEGTTFLGALPAHGKTLVALSIARALTTQKPLFGNPEFAVKEKRSVLYLIPETGDRAFRSRCEKFQIPDDEAFLCRTISSGASLSLDNPLLLEAVRQLRPVVFLDTAIRFSESADENSAAANKQLVDDVTALRAAGAIAVVLLHHAKKDSGSTGQMSLENMLRGTGDFAAMCDTAYGIRRDDSLYNNGGGPLEIDVANIKPRDLVNPPPPFRLAATYKKEGSVFPVSHINETGDFVVVNPDETTQRVLASLLRLVANNPDAKVKDLAEATGLKEYTVRQELRKHDWHSVQGGPKGSSPWHQDNGQPCPYERPKKARSPKAPDVDFGTTVH